MEKRVRLSKNSTRVCNLRENLNKLNCKRSQITIFVIIALILVVSIGGYFIGKNYFFNQIPSSISPVYEYYISCIKTSILEGADILGSQAGYIELPEFTPGSTYSPFSNQLGFVGRTIPYWYYISGNGVEKEQVPSKKQMEFQLEKYLLKEAINKCDFNSFVNNGYNISFENPLSVSVSMTDKKISVYMSQKLNVQYQDKSLLIKTHNLEVDSNLGGNYKIAKQIYDYESNNLFLENYSMDVLYTYAPVSGVKFNCTPIVWNPSEVISKLKNALSVNMGAIKIKGDYYSPQEYTDYFVAGKSSNIVLKDQQVSFLYSPEWPSRFEVWPTNNNLMIAKPLGTQQGLAIMGFCYSPYKFVYDLYFPVLIQVYSLDGEEMFQFPMSIVINKNNPRKSLESEYTEPEISICDNANTEITVNTYNINLEPLVSDVEFKCLSDSCILGKTNISGNSSRIASINAKVPQCINGLLIAKSEGYSDKKYLISTNEENSADIILDKKYKLKLEIYVDGQLTSDLAILGINENVDNATESLDSVSYPYSEEVELSEKYYNFNLMVYKKGGITIPSSTSKQCINVPRAGVLGLFGMEEEKCTDITLPSQTISNIIYAGGTSNYYTTPDELENARVMKVYATSVKLPSSYEEIPESYDLVDGKNIDIGFE
jgi:hypothetical protein